MEIKTNRVREISNIIDLLSSFVEDVVFVVDQEGIKIKTVDPMMVCLLNIKINKSLFEEYSVLDNEKIKVSLSLLKQILKKAKRDDRLFFKTEDHKMKIVIDGKNKKTFYIALMDIEETDIPELNLSLSSEIDLFSDSFLESIEDASMFSDEVIFVADKESFIISSKEDNSSMESKYIKEGESLISLSLKDGEEKVVSRYAADFLKKIGKCKKISPTVKIKYGTDQPAVFEYSSKDDVKIEIVLAPRVS